MRGASALRLLDRGRRQFPLRSLRSVRCRRSRREQQARLRTCSGDLQASCLAKVSNYTTAINNVRGWIQSDLGINLPLGITEWNMDPGINGVLGNDPNFMAQFSTNALNLMIAAKLDFANQFDVECYGQDGTLDMFDINNQDQPKAQFNVMVSLIQQYKQ
jgi:hypothetical protein